MQWILNRVCHGWSAFKKVKLNGCDEKRLFLKSCFKYSKENIYNTMSSTSKNHSIIWMWDMACDRGW